MTEESRSKLIEKLAKRLHRETIGSVVVEAGVKFEEISEGKTEGQLLLPYLTLIEIEKDGRRFKIEMENSKVMEIDRRRAEDADHEP